MKSSGLGAVKAAADSSDAPATGSRPDAGNADTGSVRVDGAEGDASPTVVVDADGIDLLHGTGGALGWDGGQTTDGLAGLDGSVGSGGAVGTGGFAASGGVLGTGGAPGTGGGGVPDGALGTGGVQGTGGMITLGGALGTGGAGADSGVETGDAAAEAGPESGPDAAPDHAEPDAAADAAADLRDARDGRIADSRRDAARVDAASLSLVWSDEFNAPADTGVDSSKWNYVTWLPGQVNNEKQRYTSSLANVFHDGDGHLVLRALYTPNAVYPYTSGRIDTDKKVSFGPGHRVEVKAKLPAGAGSFPGIIMMGTSGSWPACGQLTMMEQYGKNKSIVYSAVYAGSSEGSGSVDVTPYAFSDDTTASADFHLYSLDWYPDHVEFQVDGEEVLRSSYATTSPLYNITEYLILDVALGGTMGGAIDNSAFPMDMVIDYVRVYEF